MFDLSRKYFSTTNELQRTMYLSAGEALLVRGEHGSLGVFIGFVLLTLSNLLISFVILNGQIFKNRVGFMGIIGSSSLLVYLILVTFFPKIDSFAVLIAAPGGILVLVWYLFVGLKLIRIGTDQNN